jgi:hypothetical protein
VGEAQECFGKDAIVWQQWDEDTACQFTPRVGYGPHAPQPTDCLCSIDSIATARRAGFDYHYLDNEPYYWASITRREPNVPWRLLSGLWLCLGGALGFAACLGLISLAVHLDTYRERASVEITTTGRFGMPKPVEKRQRRGVHAPVYRYSCPELPPEVGSCESDASEASH